MKNNELDKIYKMYYKDVYIYALSLCKDYQMADDMVSDTFYKAFVSIGCKENYMKQWLFLICKNNYRDLLRKKKRRIFVRYEENISLSDSDVLDKLLITEKNKELFKAITKLDEKYREVITLHYFSNYSLKDVAKLTGLSYGASRTVLYRARIKLKKELEESYEF